MRVFVAGATGAIGRPLMPMLLAAGHQVTAMTRWPEKAAALKAQGVTAVVVDAYDTAAMRKVLAAARPEAVIHQLTDLPQRLDPADAAEALARNARLRIETTAPMVEAARAAGARRFIAQSIAFAYAPGTPPLREEHPLDLGAEGMRAASVKGVVALERAVLDAEGLEGIVLRYGRLYGPGTWFARPEGTPALHVAPAAHAALLALTRGEAGIYNIAEDDGAVAIDKARRDLGFNPDYRAS